MTESELHADEGLIGQEAVERLAGFVRRLEGEVEERTRELRESEQRYRFLLQISSAVNASFRIDEIFRIVVQSIRQFFVFHRASIALVDESGKSLRFFALEPDGEGALGRDAAIPVDGSAMGWVVANGRVRSCSDLAVRQDYYEEMLLIKGGVRSYIMAPLIFRGRVIGTFNLSSRDPHQFTTDDVRFLEQIAEQITVAVGSARAYEEIARLRDALAEENIYLRDEIRLAHPFHEIIGRSPVMGKVLRDVERVAGTDTTVLLRGETGTGKELVARAIHNLSPRNAKPLIKVNCSALSESLIASELFGHEKGAFTGADRRKPGRFELADGGTIFLDEIGELSPDIQVKILRVLQEHEIERVGGTETIRINVRVIAATNRNLEAAIAAGSFRDDLYYRLNVFPIDLPALSDHRQDIDPLMDHFVAKYSTRMQKRVTRISQKTRQLFMQYDWPGNVRELENVIERGVILCDGETFDLDEKLLFPRGRTPRRPDSRASDHDSDPVIHPAVESPGAAADTGIAPPAFSDQVGTIIRRALVKSGWRIYGPDWAAKLLNLPPTTLQAKMKRLGIDRRRESGERNLGTDITMSTP